MKIGLLNSNKFKKEIEILSSKLNLYVTTESNHQICDFLFYFDIDNALCLKQISNKTVIKVDFTKGKLNHRRLYGGGLNQAIAKAVGLKRDKKPTILDATAGLGQDAFVLASLGSKITLIEKSPIIFALLEDGLKRASNHPDLSDIIKRMNIIQGDSITYMQKLDEKPDVVYLDPMFPETKNTALPKKEMQILKAFLGNKIDELELFNAAINCAQKRVVVKRPRLSEPLANQKPSFIIKGKSSRFDIYVSENGNYR